MDSATRGTLRGHRLLGGLFAILLFAGAANGLLHLWWIGERLGAFEVLDWATGRATAAIDEEFARSFLPENDSLQLADSAWQYRFLGTLGRQVREGCPGWLFYEEALSDQPGGQAAFAARLEILHRLEREVARRGLRLLVVTVPDKARVVPQQTCGIGFAPHARARYDLWQQALTAEGVDHLDLLPVLRSGADPFYRTDVHWTAGGAEAAAAAVAGRVEQALGGQGPARYEVTGSEREEERIGDLIHLAGLEGAAPGWRPAGDLMRPRSVTLKSGGLLDPVAPPEILLAGSSFSRRSEFAGRLGLHSGRAVWNASLDGGRFIGAFADLLRADTPWPDSLRLVVWELSEYSLLLPLDDQERDLLAWLRSKDGEA